MQRRKPLRRGKPPVRTKPIARSRKPIKARKADPSKRRFAKHRCIEYLAWLPTQPCCVTGKREGAWVSDGAFYIAIDPAHVRPRSLGGDDLWNALPLAHHLHVEQHRIGLETFWKEVGLDPVKIAAEHTERFLAEHPELAAGRGSEEGAD
jgi:hypothetical protein